MAGRGTSHPLPVGIGIGAIAAAASIGTVADPDAGWMLATGNLVLHGHLPRTELWSWSARGVPYVAHEWGSATLMAALSHLLGFRGGLAGWQFLALTLAFGLLAVQALRAGYRPVPVAAGVAALDVAGSVIWLPRGLLASVPFLVAEAWWWRRACAGRVRRAPWWELLAWQAVWVNLHGMAVLGPLMPLGFAAVTLAGNRLRLRGAGENPVPLRALVRRIGWRLPGQFATPYGLAGALHAYVVVTRSTSVIQEYLPPDFQAPNVLLAAVLLGLALLWLARGDQPRQALVLAGLVLAGLYSARYLLLAVVFAAPAWIQLAQAICTADPATAALPASAALRARWATRAERAGPVYAGLRRLVAREFFPALLAVLFTALAATVAVSTLGRRLPARRDPAAVVRWLQAHPEPNRPLFNSYATGGYLVYTATRHLLPGGQLPWRVVIDGRNDTYPRQVFADYLAVTGGHPGWWQVLDPRTGLTVLAPVGGTVSGLVSRDPGWRLAFHDRRWQVWVPDLAHTRPLPNLRQLRLSPR